MLSNETPALSTTLQFTLIDGETMRADYIRGVGAFSAKKHNLVKSACDRSGSGKICEIHALTRISTNRSRLTIHSINYVKSDQIFVLY